MSDSVRSKAYDLYKEKNGKIKLTEIAKIFNISYSNVAYWKKADNWSNALKQDNLLNSQLDAVDKNSFLSEQEKLFCLSYVKNFNAYQSAINAGFSKKNARQKGLALLSNPYVIDLIQELKNIRRSSLLIDEFDVLERHMLIAFADINDYVTFGTEVDEQSNNQKNVLYFKDSSSVDGCLISEISKTRDGPHIKLADRQKSLDWLSSYFFLNPLDKHKQDFDLKKLALEQEKLQLSRNDSIHPVEIEIKRKD